ncbi:MAG: PKD domain-containing protein [Bacteroidales bacterium]
MKSRTNGLILLLAAMQIALSLISCTGKDDPPDIYINTPIAGFTWTGNDHPAPVTVQFVNTSEYADQFEWDFGDGQSSTQRDPQHTYYNTSGQPRNFTVILKATDPGTGMFQRQSKVIVIQPGAK